MVGAESTYELRVHGLEVPGLDQAPDLRVQRFVCRERLSAPYEVEIELDCDGHRDLPREMIRRRAVFSMHLTSPPQVFHGVVSEVALIGHGRRGGELRATYRLRLVPRLWLMTKKRRSRVFQNKSVDEVVKAVLEENHVPALWLLQRPLPKRDYCVQFEETDEELVRRLFAEAGIFFFFLQPPPVLPDEGDQIMAMVDDVLGAAGGPSITGEVMVVADDAMAYHALGELPPGLETLLRSGLAQLDRLSGGVVGEVAHAAEAIGGVVSDLGGPDLRSLLALGNSRTLLYRPQGEAMNEDHRDILRTMTLCHAVRSDAVTFRAYDPRRPLAPLSFSEPAGGPAGRALSALGVELPEQVAEVAAGVARVGGALGGVVGEAAHALGLAIGEAELEVYEHHDPFLLPDWDYAKTEPGRILRGERADQRLGRATGICSLASCGRRFTLADHPIEWMNREYAIVEVQHFGRSSASVSPDEDVYSNELVVVPSDVPFVPPRPPRRSVQTCLTATVIGHGGSAEIATHSMGEIKVRFHWERGDQGTCWVRTMQSWAGAGWGTQFMPRIGMEVVVGFEGGDPDRPVVLGCVYNGTHPAPFSLPESQTRNGIRTQSTPGGEGFNELSFEDRKHEELIYVRAERDLAVAVNNDRRATIHRDDHLEVEHAQRVVVRGRQTTEVQRGQETIVRDYRRVEVVGTHEVTTRGDRSEQVADDARLEVGGALTQTIGNGSMVEVGGDATRRVGGSLTELVRGAHNLRVEGVSQASSGEAMEISSDSEVVLRVGNSYIRISENAIELVAPEIALAAEGASARLGEADIKLLADGDLQGVADKILLKSSGAALGLSSEASVDGSRVLLNSPQSASDAVEPEEREPTIIELRDQDGHPVPNQRYRIELDDGSTRTGVLDEEGRAVVFLEGSGEVIFPDLAEVQSS